MPGTGVYLEWSQTSQTKAAPRPGNPSEPPSHRCRPSSQCSPREPFPPLVLRGWWTFICVNAQPARAHASQESWGQTASGKHLERTGSRGCHQTSGPPAVWGDFLTLHWRVPHGLDSAPPTPSGWEENERHCGHFNFGLPAVGLQHLSLCLYKLIEWPIPVAIATTPQCF